MYWQMPQSNKGAVSLGPYSPCLEAGEIGFKGATEAGRRFLNQKVNTPRDDLKI